MRHAAIYSVFLLTFIGLAATTADAQIAWEGKLRDAHSKAKQQGKLMLLHFYTDNCIYCDRLEAGAFRSNAVIESINQNFVPVKVHGGKNDQLAKMFKVTKFPTDVVVTVDGKALSHSVSPQQPDRYIAMLSGAQVSHAKTRNHVAAQPTPPATSPAPASTTPTNPAATGIAAAPGVSPTSPTAAITPAPQTQSPAAAPTMTAATQPAMATQGSAAPQTNQFVMPEAATPSTLADKPMVSPAATAATAPTKTAAPAKGTVSATLASSRSGGFSLPSDVSSADAPSGAAPESAAPNTTTTALSSGASAEAAVKPELAIQGFCAVSVVEKGQWVEGKPELGVIHLGRLYLFADKEAMEVFLADPIPYTPMLNEIDVVRFFEDKKIVQGKREWGLFDPVHNRMFFFADEQAMLHFEKSFDRYLEAAIEVMDQAIKESNPGV